MERVTGLRNGLHQLLFREFDENMAQEVIIEKYAEHSKSKYSYIAENQYTSLHTE